MPQLQLVFDLMQIVRGDIFKSRAIRLVLIPEAVVVFVCAIPVWIWPITDAQHVAFLYERSSWTFTVRGGHIVTLVAIRVRLQHSQNVWLLQELIALIDKLRRTSGSIYLEAPPLKFPWIGKLTP